MKKIYTILGLLLIVFFTTPSFAQQLIQETIIPIDTAVRIGTLPNGLTYYIRHNEKPKNRVFFNIAQQVGSILEEPEQRGLAHFLEHMCFNGTNNFPGSNDHNGIISWSESKGLRFGVDINAATGIDQTVYRISNVPTTHQGVLDSCLLILHDWAGALLLQDKEIDKERGVIHEEWRTTKNAQSRWFDKIMPVLYPNSKYADCLPIGSMDVVMNFKYDRLRNYYHKWYRPDLQGIVIVGDIDVDQMEEKVKQTFGSLKVPENPAQRIYYPVSDNKEPITLITADKEENQTSFIYMYKHPASPKEAKKKISYYIQDVSINLMTEMLDNRLSELTQKPNPPFINAYTQDGDYFASQTMGAFTSEATCYETAPLVGMKALMRELLKAKAFGFTATELKRAKAKYSSQIRVAYNERNKIESSSFSSQYISHFLRDEPIPNRKQAYELTNQILPMITLDMINEETHSLIGSENSIYLLNMPQKEGLSIPTKAQLLQAIQEVKKEKLTPYIDKINTKPLIKGLPTKGKISGIKENRPYGCSEVTLSNGVKIILKPTTFKADEISMTAISKGGQSLYKDKDTLLFKAGADIATIGGLGEFSQTELSKRLADRIIEITPSIDKITEKISASCAPKDFALMMQLTYLYFTNIRKDEEAFKAYTSRLKSYLVNQEANPMTAFVDTIKQTLYNTPRVKRLSASEVDKIDYNQLVNYYKERFADANDFVFLMVGNIDLDKDLPLIEKYLGALPVLESSEKIGPFVPDYQEGNITNDFKKEQSTPKSSIFQLYSMDGTYNLRNTLLSEIFGQLMEKRYLKVIREDEGAAYSPQVNASIHMPPNSKFTLQIVIDTDPAKRIHILEIIKEQLDDMVQNGVNESNFNDTHDYLLKSFNQDIENNNYWMQNLIAYYFYDHIDTYSHFEKTLKAIQPKEIQAFAKKLMDSGNKIEVIMTSKDEK